MSGTNKGKSRKAVCKVWTYTKNNETGNNPYTKIKKYMHIKKRRRSTKNWNDVKLDCYCFNIKKKKKLKD